MFTFLREDDGLDHGGAVLQHESNLVPTKLWYTANWEMREGGCPASGFGIVGLTWSLRMASIPGGSGAYTCMRMVGILFTAPTLPLEAENMRSPSIGRKRR